MRCLETSCDDAVLGGLALQESLHMSNACFAAVKSQVATLKEERGGKRHQ